MTQVDWAIVVDEAAIVQHLYWQARRAPQFMADVTEVILLDITYMIIGGGAVAACGITRPTS